MLKVFLCLYCYKLVYLYSKVKLLLQPQDLLDWLSIFMKTRGPTLRNLLKGKFKGYRQTPTVKQRQAQTASCQSSTANHQPQTGKRKPPNAKRKPPNTNPNRANRPPRKPPTAQTTNRVNRQLRKPPTEVDAEKTLVCEHVEASIKAGSKRGQHKKKHDLEDIVKMLVQCDRSCLPRFVALDLAKLPPISIDCIDVSAPMRKQQLQDAEISSLKEMVKEILTVTAETSKRVEVELLSKQRGATMAATSPASGSETLSASSVASGKPELVTKEAAEEYASGPSYSEAVKNGVANPDCNEWVVANRRKRATVPAMKPLLKRGASAANTKRSMTWKIS